jgi:hypothetical protein
MLPAETLTAVVSAREITLNSLGRPAVIVFHGQDTGAAAIEINNTVRATFPTADEVLIASVIDLRQFPAMFHAMVKPELEKAYHKAAGKLPEGADPTELIVLLPDWKGAIHNACGVENSTKQAVVVVADASGKILATLQGEDLGAATVSALKQG